MVMVVAMCRVIMVMLVAVMSVVVVLVRLKGLTHQVRNSMQKHLTQQPPRGKTQERFMHVLSPVKDA